MMAAALDYLARDWWLVPIRPDGKAPLTEHGVHDASNSEATVVPWLRRWVPVNLAVVPGRSGLAIADIDSGRAEDTAGRLGMLAEDTYTVATGRRHYPPHHPKHFSRARHLYFTAPLGVPLRKRTLDGLELFVGGGYCLVPPSRHAPTGATYELEYDTEPLPLPARAVAALTRASDRRAPCRSSVAAAADLDHALECLVRLDIRRSDEYLSWVEVGMALHGASGGDAHVLDAWREWSRRSPKFNEAADECAAKWASFGHYAGPGLGLGSLIHWVHVDTGERATLGAARR
jgi:hypothetical protein